MRIGIIGSGHVGGALAARFVRAGHDVALSNSHDPKSLRDEIAVLGDRARALTPMQAAAFGDFVVVAIPFGRYPELPFEGMEGKIVIDATNYFPYRDGANADLESGRFASSELIQRHFREARVVKAFNTLFWQWIRDRGESPGSPNRIALPVCGDDANAKGAVIALVDEIGFDAVDAGSLADSRHQQPGTPVFGATSTRTEIENQLRVPAESAAEMSP